MIRIFTSGILFFFIFFCFYTPLKGNNLDNIRFVQLTLQQGLPQNHVLSILQDHKGFIWLGTRNGLCLYDGYRIRTYVHNPDDSTSLDHDGIKKVFEDSRKRLWIATEQGLCLYNRQLDNFKRYGDSPSMPNQLYTLFELPGGKVVASTNHGIYYYNEKKDCFLILQGKNGKPFAINSTFNDFTTDDNGIVWAATSQGIICMNPEKITRINCLPDSGNGELLKMVNASAICKDNQGRIWAGSVASGLFVYDPADRSVRNFDKTNGLTSNYIRCLNCDDNGNIWAGTECGINIITPDVRTIKHLTQDISGTSNLNDNAIYSIYRDNADNMWVGTYFGGVNIHFKGFENFSTYSYGFSDKHLSGKAVRQIIADTDKSLWIATEDGGLNHFDRTTGKIEHYKSPKDRIGISYSNVHSLLKDRKGNLWIGMFSGGLNRYNPQTGQMKYYSIKEGNLTSNMVFCLLEDHHGTIWAGTMGGLLRYNPGADKFIPIADATAGRSFVYCLHEDSEGVVWVGMRRKGLIKMDPVSGLCAPVRTGDYLQNFITSLYEDEQKNIWIGTNDGGIIRYDRQKDVFKNYTTAQGLPSNNVTAITQDEQGDIWLSTNAGLCCFDTANGVKTNYTTNDGLPINQFNYASAFRADDGQLFFGSINGMIAFYPQLLKDYKGNLHVEITDFKIHGEEVGISLEDSPLRENITETSRISLSHNQASSFSFGYTGLNYSHASSIVYAIRMTGIDTNWQVVGHQRQILFSSLPAGKYNLCIKASYDGIHWDEGSVRCIDIVIHPPFWQSWIAYIIYICIVIALCYFTFRVIRARIRFKMILKTEHAAKLQSEELNQQKINFFTNVSHDLKTPLTLILSPLKKIIGEQELSPEIKDKLSAVLRNAQRMQYLIDELMTFSKIEMKRLKITVRQGDVLSFMEEICHIFRIVANEGGINFVTKIENGESPKEVWFSPLKLERIMYNLLSNAFKFTPAGGTIVLSARLQERADGMTMLHFTVEDTGIGIPEEYLQKIFENYYQVDQHDDKHGSGIGLALTKSLVSIHKGNIKVESKPGQGTTFRIELNVSGEAFSDDEKSIVKLDKENITSYNYPLLTTSEMLQEKLQEPAVHKDNSKYHILIVEDNREMNDFIAEIFSEEYTVIRAYNGQEGLEEALRMMPDIVISDVMMPVMDGFEMTRSLKSNLATSHIPIILLTAKTGEENMVDGFNQGADVYIEKPFSSQSLELQVKNILNTKYNNIQRFRHDPEVDVKQITSNPRDEKFMNTLLDLVMTNLDNDSFSVSDITNALSISRSLLHIKLKSLAGVSITEFIRDIRMREARSKLLSGMNVSEASFAVGISDPNYFTKCFKKQFGLTPSDFVKSIRSQG